MTGLYMVMVIVLNPKKKQLVHNTTVVRYAILMEKLLGIDRNKKRTYIWQDRQIRFDLPGNDLRPRAGEFVIDSITGIEDTKGNNGERGALIVTNLRIIWTVISNARLNLS